MLFRSEVMVTEMVTIAKVAMTPRKRGAGVHRGMLSFVHLCFQLYKSVLLTWRTAGTGAAIVMADAATMTGSQAIDAMVLQGQSSHPL